MKMRTLRKLKTQAPRRSMARLRGVAHREFDVSDATMEPDPGPGPEAVFDRVTGPYGRRHASVVPGVGSFDEDT